MGIVVLGWPFESKDSYKGIDAHSLYLNKW